MQEMDNLDDFSMKLTRLVTNIRVLAETMEESYIVKKILRTTPARFVQIASTIEQFGDMETMSVKKTM